MFFFHHEAFVFWARGNAVHIIANWPVAYTGCPEKKIHFVSFFKARASIFSKLAIIVDWRMAKTDECKINAFVMSSNIDKAICVETHFSTKSFSQTRRLLIKKLGWDHRKSRLAPNNATISRGLKEFRDGRLFHRKQGSGRPRTARSVESIRQVERSVWEERSLRAVACSPSGRSSRPSVPISSKSGSSRMAPLLIPLLHRVSGSRSASLAGSSGAHGRTRQTWVCSISSFGVISKMGSIKTSQGHPNSWGAPSSLKSAPCPERWWTEQSTTCRPCDCPRWSAGVAPTSSTYFEVLLQLNDSMQMFISDIACFAIQFGIQWCLNFWHAMFISDFIAENLSINFFRTPCNFA